MTVLNHFFSQKMLMGCKIESTPYTAESTVQYDVLAKNLQVSPSIERFAREYSVGDFDPFEDIAGARMGEISFGVDLQGSGSATTPPKWGKLMQGCAWRQTIGGFGVVYVKDANANAVPLTFEVVFKGSGDAPIGLKVKLRGCMGEVDILVTKTGEPIQANFKFKGPIVSVSDLTAATVPGATGYDTTVPPAFLSAAFKLYGYDLTANNIAIKSGNQVEMLRDLRADEGYEGAYVVGGKSTFTADPYLAREADAFLYQRATGQTGPLSGALVMWAGSTAVPGNFLRIDAAAAQITKSHNIGSREGTDMNPIEGHFNRGSTGAYMLQVTQGSYTGIAGY